MKYIRTKDGRILKGSNFGFGVGMPYKNYDVKVADTIEELCDEFVWDEDICFIDFENKTLRLKGDDYNFSLDYCLKSKKPIYGAIWTDKGLIYVTRMKGILPSGETDWELL